MTLLTKKHWLSRVGVFAAFLLLTLAIAPFFGSEAIGFAAPWSETEWQIIYLRLLRILLGLFAGGALAIAGAAFQAILHNPLATPYTLGVASGSAVGAFLAIALGWKFSLGPFHSLQIGSFGGAGLIVLAIYALARSRFYLDIHRLLLAGVTLGITASAFILFIRYLTTPNRAVLMDRWTMGSLDITTMEEFAALFPLGLPGVMLLFLQSARLNQLALGEEMAAARGVEVPKLQRLTFLGGSLITASVVAVAGPIAFVGLIVPHAVRRLVGADHRLLLPCCFLGGASFLILCDLLARSAGTWLHLLGGGEIGKMEIPVGILTALLGGPFFFFLLFRQDKP